MLGTDTCNGVYDSGLKTYSGSYSALTYKAGFEYDVTPTSLLYVQTGTGYKAGGFDTTAFPPRTYQPEKLTAYELGSKNRFFDNALEVNAEAYYYQYRNLQVQYGTQGAVPIPAADIPDGGTTSIFQQYVINAGSGTNKGFEVEAKYRLTPQDQIIFNPAFADAKYGYLDPATGYGFLTGTQIVNTPKWSGTIGYEHTFDVYEGSLTLKVQSKLSSGYWPGVNREAATLAGGPPFVTGWQAGYSNSSAFLTYDYAAKPWSLNFWVKNLENRAQMTAVYPLMRVSITDPRTFGVNSSFKF